MPKAIQPHCVLELVVVSLLFAAIAAPAAAAPAGLTPELVVVVAARVVEAGAVTVVVAGGTAVTVVSCVCVTVTVDGGFVCVTGGAEIVTVSVEAVSVWVDLVWVSIGVLWVGVCAVCVRVDVERVGVVRVEVVRFVPATVLPPPHDDRAMDASKPRAPAATSPTMDAPEREPRPRSTQRARRLRGCVLIERAAPTSGCIVGLGPAQHKPASGSHVSHRSELK
jgi:hypothetical protein